MTAQIVTHALPHRKSLARKLSSLVERIGGQVQIAEGDNGIGTRFTVLFT
jgi:hypothetical protein